MKTLVKLLAAAIEMQVVTGCKAVPEMQRFVLEDGTVIVADTGAGRSSKKATENFKRLYAAVGNDADIEDPQACQLALAKMLGEVDLDDPVVQEALGDMHYLGCGVRRDGAKAVGWYKRAAENNRPGAQTWIGWAYWYGFHCLPCDQVEAVKWFRKTTENGSADAPRLLGAAYAEGRGGLPVDKKLAFQCFLKSVGVACIHGVVLVAVNVEFSAFRVVSGNDSVGGKRIFVSFLIGVGALQRRSH